MKLEEKKLTSESVSNELSSLKNLKLEIKDLLKNSKIDFPIIEETRKNIDHISKNSLLNVIYL